MAEFGGKPASLWMNYDLTFLSVLLSSLEGAGTPRSLPCTALPWRKVQVAPLPIWGRRALAALNLALLAAKLEDDRQDEKGLTRKLAGAWVGSYQRKVDLVLGETGFPLESIRQLPRVQAAVEARASTLEELSRPTAEVIAQILEHVGELSGRSDRDLRGLGFALGRFLYYLDAAQDFQEDARKKRFNALRACWGAEWQEARAAALLHASLERLSLELRKFADLEPLGSLIDPLLDSLADRLPVHQSWVPSWRKAQAANCDCGGADCSGCDGGGECCNAECCSNADCCSSGGTSHGCCCTCPDTLDCACWSCDCCSSSSEAGKTGTPLRVDRKPLVCPGCNATLKAQKAGKVEVDFCPFCAGIWLDKNELKALAKMRALPGWLLEPIPSAPDKDLVPEGQRECPRCKMKLQTADSKGVQIDLCRGCEGVWLDRGELNRLLQ